MAIKVSFGKCEDSSSVRLSGLLGTPADIAALEHLLRIPRFRSGMPWIIDNRSQVEIPTLGEVERLIHFFRDHARAMGPARIAIVAGLPGAFAMGRVAEVLAADLALQIRSFWSVVEARDWLHRRLAPHSSPLMPGVALASG